MAQTAMGFKGLRVYILIFFTKNLSKTKMKKYSCFFVWMLISIDKNFDSYMPQFFSVIMAKFLSFEISIQTKKQEHFLILFFDEVFEFLIKNIKISTLKNFPMLGAK